MLADMIVFTTDCTAFQQQRQSNKTLRQHQRRKRKVFVRDKATVAKPYKRCRKLYKTRLVFWKGPRFFSGCFVFPEESTIWRSLLPPGRSTFNHRDRNFHHVFGAKGVAYSKSSESGTGRHSLVRNCVFSTLWRVHLTRRGARCRGRSWRMNTGDGPVVVLRDDFRHGCRTVWRLLVGRLSAI